MFIPVHDNNPVQHIRFAYITFGLIALNTVIFVLQLGLSDAGQWALFYSAGAIPSSVLSFAPAPGTDHLHPGVTLFTYMFLHAGWMHLIGNMIFLYVFGDNVEDAMGHGRFLVFYLLCGVLAGAAHAVATPGSTAPLIGASGATSGLVGAYLLLHPRVNMWILVLWRIPLPLRASWVILAWLAFQVFYLWTSPNAGVAWWAHLGGFAAGMLLIPLFKRRDVPLLDKGLF